MSEVVVTAALEEVMEDKWILNYCTKEPALRSSTSVCQKRSKGSKKRHHKEDRHHKDDTDAASKRLKMGKTRINVDHTVKRKGSQGSRPLKDASSEPLRRSFWQLDRLQDNGGYGELRRTTRLSEKNPPKRRIRKPKWLLEDSGTLEENNVSPKMKKYGSKHQKHHQSSVEKRPETGQIKNNAKHKPAVNSHLMAKENSSKHQKGFSMDCLQPDSPPQVILELSLPDNELMGMFIEDSCSRQRGFPQVLLYKPTVKLPTTSQPVKTVHGKEVILRARDATMFVKQLHCYARRQKGKGNGSNIQGSVSTITRSSVQGSPPKGQHIELCEQPAAEMKGGLANQTPAADEITESPAVEKLLQVQTTKTVSRKTSSSREPSEKSSVEMKVTVASQTPAAAKATEYPVLDKVPRAQITGKVLHNKTRERSEKSAAEMKVANASQTVAATEVTEAPLLDNVLQAQARELCEESAVEMKVTIASQTPTTGKIIQSPGFDKFSKAQAVKDVSKTTTEVLQTLTVDKNQMVVTEEILPVSNAANISNIGAADPIHLQSQDVVLRNGKELELKSLSSQAETGSPEVLTTVSNSISDISHKLSEGPVPCENDRSPGGTMVTIYAPTDQDSISDISALTLVTEMVTELAPETLAHKGPAPEDSATNESRAGSKHEVPYRLHTTSSCSGPDPGASALTDVQGTKEGTQDITFETPENSEPMESEESKLEYCCTFCNKLFKGSRVVAHAMFHYRKDECMFCGIMFKDDLLAMMHLSDHIEKLKRSKDSAGNSTQENWVSETKDTTTPKTSAKAKTTTVSSGRRSSGRPRKSAVCPLSVSLPDSALPGSRKLRSSGKPVGEPYFQEKKQNFSKHLNSTAAVHKVNGHIGKKSELDRLKRDPLNLEAKQPCTQQETSQEETSDATENPKLQENLDKEVDSATSVQVDKVFSSSSNDNMETESLQVLKTTTKQVVEEKNLELQKKFCCPVDGCAWFADLSKNRVALLYHALEDHYGEVKPLQLAFRIGKNRCSICMRVLWSFEHFQHHVERHKLTPRHPCLHQGCTARFKTGMEMRRHARRHSPLQAVCCLPGCSQLFICLWALNLHEREHYASKPTKPIKATNKQTGDKQSDHKTKNETATTTANRTESVKATCKSRGQATHNSSTETHVKAPSPTIVRASLLKQELEGSSETKDSHVLKNLSNKDTSTQPTGPNLRLRQTLRKVKGTNTTLAVLKSHKVIPSSLLKHSFRLRHKFKKKQVKVNTKGPERRGRPPKSKKAVHDENTTTGQNNESVKEKNDQRSPAQLASRSKAAEPSNVSKALKEEKMSQQVQDVVKTTETSIDESKSKKSVNKQIKKNHTKQKGVSHNTSRPTVTANRLNQSVTTTFADKTQKSTTGKMKKDGCHPASDSCKSEKRKVSNGKANSEMKKKCPLKELGSASKKCAKSNSAVPGVEAKPAATATATVGNSADEEGKAKVENTDSTQKPSGNSVPAVPANCLNDISAPPTTSGEKAQKVTTEVKSKKAHVMKKERNKEKNTRTTSSDAGKTKHKVTHKKGDKKVVKERQPCNDESKSSVLKKTAKSKPVVQQFEGKAAEVQSSRDVEGKMTEDTSDATLESSGSSIPAATGSGLSEITCPPTATEESVQKATEKEKSKKSHVTKMLDPNKANKKRKLIPKDGDTKTVKKKCKHQGVPSVSQKPAKSDTEVQLLTEVKAEVVESSVAEEGETSADTAESTISSPGYSVIMNGQAATEDAKSTACKDALAEYSKRPYMRPPPTAYLDEKYITMPKRRKEMSGFHSFQRSLPPEQAKVATALQRQRCANCFATFNSTEDLQSHLQVKKCSSLFGFDSDDESEYQYSMLGQ